MSGSRMKIAGRFKPCIHMGCFDLEVFVEMNQRSRKARFQMLYDLSTPLWFFIFWWTEFFLQWQCPVCLKNYALENIIIDPYFNRITSMV